MQKELVDAEVQYGIGAVCEATLEEPQGLTARELIREVIGRPQKSEPAQRAARVLAEVIDSGRTLDVEVTKKQNSHERLAEPAEPNDVVIKSRDESIETDKLTLRASEPYVGG
jgi:hypothetical protein